MKRIALSFESDVWGALLGRAASPRLRFAAAIFALASLCAIALALWRFVEAQHDLGSMRLAIAAASANAPILKPALAEVQPVSLQRITALARVTRHLNTPWPAILDALEQHATSDIALLSIDPDPVQGRVRLEFEARKLQSLLDFAQRLGGSPRFDRVALLRHEVIERDPARPYRMTIEAVLANASAMAGAGRP